jgi:hypothetical protein
LDENGWQVWTDAFRVQGVFFRAKQSPRPQGTRFLRGDTLPGYAVLEFDTLANPIRVFLSRDQLEHLARYARMTLAKIESDERIY